MDSKTFLILSGMMYAVIIGIMGIFGVHDCYDFYAFTFMLFISSIVLLVRIACCDCEVSSPHIYFLIGEIIGLAITVPLIIYHIYHTPDMQVEVTLHYLNRWYF